MTAHILIADDNLQMQQFYLETFGEFDFDLASGGVEMLGLAMAKPYRLILTDLTMPDITGVEAMRHIRDNPGPNRNTCICAISGDPTDEARKSAKSAGFDAHFQKPISLKHLTNLFIWASQPDMPRFLFPEDG